MKLVCFASPTSFNPAPDGWCRGCVDFGECGKLALAKVRALARVKPLGDVAEALEIGLKRAGTLPAGEVGGEPTPLPEPNVELTAAPPERTFDRLTRRELLEEEQQFLGRLPKKVADRIRPMIKRGRYREIRDGMLRGINPFPPSSLPYLRVGADMLIKTGRLDKGALKTDYMQRLDWTEGTAAARVAVVCRIFVELGCAVDDGHVLTYTPKT